jgi:hypothetical protein
MNEERQYSEQECNYSIKIGMAGGFIVGWAIGVALLYAVPMSQGAWEFAIPFWNAIGWMLYGMIGGCGGTFADCRFSPKTEYRLNHVLHFAEKRTA